jgi:hypothetical protein
LRPAGVTIIEMKVGTGKAGSFAVLAIGAALAPLPRAPTRGGHLRLRPARPQGDRRRRDQRPHHQRHRRIDNRISAFTDPTGRLVLSAPEGLGDPDGSGANCQLDNAKPGESSAQQVSCGPGYIGAIVGDLGVEATRSMWTRLAVMIGAVVDGQRRPLWGGAGATGWSAASRPTCWTAAAVATR